MGTVDVAAIPERVAAGVALLDQAVPGWAQRIDPDRLNMESCWTCVLGQLFGGYDAGLNHLNIVHAATNGFCCAVEPTGLTVTEYLDATDADYLALNAEWRNVITARQGEA